MKRHWAWTGLLAGLIAAVLGVVIKGPELAANAREYDMLGLLREIRTANDAIEEVNGAILTTMGNVQQQAGRVGHVHTRLTSLEEGLHEQQAVLERLRTLTAEQAELSRALQSLTASIRPSTAGIAATAAAEAKAIGQMQATTAGLASDMAQIGTANRSMALKLRRAEELSALVLARMP